MTFETLGCVVEDACPELTEADSIFLTIRAFRTATDRRVVASHDEWIDVRSREPVEFRVAAV